MTVSRAGVPGPTPRWRAFVDGGCYPNPEGIMGIGVVIEDPGGTTVAEISERLPGLGTNNEAEYRATLRALVAASELGAKRIEINADSRLTVNTLSGQWQVRAPNLIPLKQAIDGVRGDFELVLFRWIPREENKRADALATKAIGGSVGGATKYGKKPATTAAKGPARPKPEGALCGACKKMCTFEWQTFANGSHHIRQACPTHGFLGFAPREKVYEALAGPEPR